MVNACPSSFSNPITTNIIISPQLGLCLICSKIYLLFLPKLPKIFTHYSFVFPWYHQLFLFYFFVSVIILQCRSDYINYLHSRLCLLTTLIEYLTVLLEYLDLFANWVVEHSKHLGGSEPC